MWLYLNAKIRREQSKSHLGDPKTHQWSSDRTWELLFYVYLYVPMVSLFFKMAQLSDFVIVSFKFYLHFARD